MVDSTDDYDLYMKLVKDNEPESVLSTSYS